MVSKSQVVGLIPARGGSKSMPRKNLQQLAGKPLIAWTIEAALGAHQIDRVIVSSDDDEIISTSIELGCEAPFIRPKELATDEAPTIDVVRHALAELGGDIQFVVLLQPTSPLRSSEDIDGAIELCREHDSESCASVAPASKSPHWMYRFESDLRLLPLIELESRPTRRQDLPEVFVLNGAIYVVRPEGFGDRDALVDSQTIGYVMPSQRSVDIDCELDLMVAEFLMNQQTHGTI